VLLEVLGQILPRKVPELEHDLTEELEIGADGIKLIEIEESGGGPRELPQCLNLSATGRRDAAPRTRT
jgi:hypothetical protein